MSDIDRYITDEAVEVVYGAMRRMAVESYDDAARTVLRAALPGILAAHRTDVLREADFCAVKKAAQTWRAPLLHLLDQHGHDAGCDAIAVENPAVCDCWRAEVNNAIEGMNLTARLADEAVAE